MSVSNFLLTAFFLMRAEVYTVVTLKNQLLIFLCDCLFQTILISRTAFISRANVIKNTLGYFNFRKE